MQKPLPSRIKNYVKLHIRDKRWKQVVAILACVVVFCTTYALILPAVTMTNNTFCGKQEHVHSDACYETVLVCGQNEQPEAESAAPSEEQPTADPASAEEAPASEEPSQAETPSEDAALAAEQAEVTPAVGASKRVLHAGTAAPHVHTEACYEKRLICQEEEHEHTLQCHSNPDAVEAPSDWTVGLPTLTGDRAKDLIAVAESQLGYTESEANFLVTEDGTVKGYTRYGAWYAGGNGTNFSYADWCACFVSFCLNHAGVTSNEFPYAAGCTDWIALLTERGQYEQKGGYTPKPGDIVFLDTNADETADHVGIVTEIDGNEVKTIEGNRGNAVGRGSYEADGAEIVGYGVLPIVMPRRAASANEALPEITVRTDPSTSHGEDTTTFYTGEAAITTLTISNPKSAEIVEDDGTVIRLYMQFDKTTLDKGHPVSADGTPSQKEGWYTVVATGSERTYEYKVTRVDGEDANHYTYCFEIQRPLQGDTISIRLSSAYPSPTSAGGTNTIWGVVLTQEQKAALDEGKDGKPGIAPKPENSENIQTVKWETKADLFTLKKQHTKNGLGQSLFLTGTSGSTSNLNAICFTIDGIRPSDTLEGKGEDYVKRVTFTDTITLPENFYFSQDVIEAIQNSTYKVRSATAGTVGFYLPGVDSNRYNDAFIRLNFGGDSKGNKWMDLEGLESKLYLDDNNRKLTVTWYVDKCLEDGTEVPKENLGQAHVKLEYGPGVICAATDKLFAEQKYTIHNEVKRTDTYCWSKDQELEASSDATIQIGAANLKLSKHNNNLGRYFGESGKYYIFVSNEGDLPYEKLAYLRDPLPENLYMSAENMEWLFTDETYGKGASVRITNATFCAVEREVVKDMNGNSAGSTAARNTSPDDNSQKYEGMSDYHQHDEDATGALNITWSEDGKNLVLTTDSGQTVSCEATASSIQEALDSLNFLVTNHTQYEVTWAWLDENGDPIPIYGHASHRIDLPVTVKDTFMLLECDWRWSYPSPTVDVNLNTIYAEDIDRFQLLSAQNSYIEKPKRDFSLGKDVTCGGNELYSVKDGNVLDYSLFVSHTGDGAYDWLPLTDHMSGTQALLAEKEKNKDAEWTANCETVTDNGKEYYLLSKPGEYKGVWLNDHYADSVTVTSADDGLDTIIKWYFRDYSGSRTDEITYRAMVCPSKLGSESEVFYIENESWLNDHQTHRLYAPIGRISGTIFVFNKKIVSKDDVEAPAGQKEAGVDECAVKEGQTVYYRFTIYPTSKDAELTLTGRDLLDRLPLGFSKDGVDFLRWEKGTKDTENPGEVWIVDYQDYADLKNPDNWNIGEDGTTDQQRINWGADFSVTIKNKPLYIYVRVTFPSGAQWEEYGAQYGNTTLENTLYIKGVADTVRHTLSIPAKAYLQKGVLNEFGFAWRFSSWPVKSTQEDALFYYANNDLYIRYVSYYAIVYNGGSTRLYLNDLQDVLPQGFTFSTMIDDTYEYSNSRTFSSVYTNEDAYGDAIRTRMDNGSDPVWVEAHVTADTSKDGMITFHIGGGNNTNKIQQIRYDELRGRYYLEPNEAIRIMYRCKTNNVEDTLDVAENSILMPYFDFNHSGLEVSETHFTRVPSGGSSDSYLPNDGSCSVIDNTQAVSLGCTSDSNDAQWLISSVRQVRDEIKPGITKRLASTLSDKGVETQNPIAAHPSDTLRWKVLAANDSNAPIVDYTLTDTMQAPYCFAGTFTYVPDESSDREGRVEFTLSEPNEKGEIKVQANYREGVQTETVTVNGDFVELKAYHDNIRIGSSYDFEYPTFFLRITKADTPDAPYTLSLRFKDVHFGIPGRGCGVLTLDTKRVDTLMVNKVFVNTCYITPMSQTWDNTTNKGNMTTLDDVFGKDNMPTVRNSAQVTTTYGYVTSSLKSVEEKNDPKNNATCNSSPNYIVLPNKESLFTYTLTVDAPDEAAMDQLILIDGLPEVGDHSCFQVDDPRYSEFDVAFADDPQISVTVTNEDKTQRTLTPGKDYTVEFSNKTEFDKNDWNGSSAWDKAHTDASRSMRIRIMDETGELIPAKSHVSVRFDGKIEGDAEPGQIAWNSFGYHYSVVKDPNELEAAPLKVGIMIPGIPELVKQVVDDSGARVAVKSDKTFRFLLYTGASLKETDEAKLSELLTTNNRDAVYLELKVEAGKSASDVMQLANLKLCTYQDGAWTPTEKPWTWTVGASYTLVELPGDDPLYHFVSINRRTNDDGYTFYYQNDQSYRLTATNALNVWSFTIQKTDKADGSALTGAWFALYSPSPDDRLTDAAYDALKEKPTQKPDLTITQDGKTWYLANVSQTHDIENKHGTLTWSGLVRDAYCYREVQAPMGYQLDETIRTATKSDLNHTVTVPNVGNSVHLPETGGIGTSWFTMGGLLLLAAACLMGYFFVRKRERGIDG